MRGQLYAEHIWKWEGIAMQSSKDIAEYDALMNAPLSKLGFWYFKRATE